MGKRTSHAPGTFSWAELSTTDAAAAKQFYTSLFGWEADDLPIPEGGTYTMLRLDGDAICALYEQPDLANQGIPPYWLSYVTVESADAAAAKAGELGAQVVADPFDVMDVGRMAVIKDPQDAIFAVWESRQHIGADRVNDAGCLSWNELHTPDLEAAISFYSSLFGWGIETMDTGRGGDYRLLKVGERSNGAAMETPTGEPPNWLCFFTVESCSDAAERVRELGGGVVIKPMEVSIGKIAIAQDPQGAVFALFEGDTDD